MSGLKSLLNYRFSRRDEEKMAASSSSPPPSETDETVVPETPPSKIPPVEHSPVFKASRGSVPRILSSGEDSPEKSSSPWLSKANGIKNGVTPCKSESVKRKYAVESPLPSSSSSSAPRSITGGRNDGKCRELKQKVEALRAIFPGCALWMLEDAAVATPDLDAAIDLIIEKNRVGQGPARPRGRPPVALSSQSSTASTASSPDIQPPRKRARRLSSESEAKDSQTSLSLTSQSLTSQSQTSQDNSQPTANPVSSTENVGSIKAYQAARKASRINRENMETSSDEETTGGDGTTTGGDGTTGGTATGRTATNSRKTDKRKSRVTDGDDDEEEVDLHESDDSDEEEKDADPIMKFFQTAELDELTTMPGCSKKKADAIVENRPFLDWNDLVAKFEQHKQLNFNLVSGCKELLKIRSTVNRLMQHCEQIAQEMESIVSALTSKMALDAGKEEGYITRQPAILEDKFTLKPYQLVGLNWLSLMHRQDLNGILADEMGLGKTIQTIAFLAQLLEEGEKGPHVIIAPSSTIDNWLRELRTWCPKLRVILYYGSQEERREMRTEIMDGRSDKFHVIVTSYNMATGGIEDRVMFKKFKFHYAVFDEGHMLKNMSSLRYQNLMKIRAQRRLLLTGTPLQNNLVELMSLLCFVMPEMFIGKTEHLKRMFTTITTSGKSTSDRRGQYEMECINRAKQIMRPFFLRRIKADVLKQLPSKVDLIQKVPLACDQQCLYDDLVTSFSKRLEVSSSLDQDLKSRGASMLMELRKAANHHLLHRRHYDDTTLKQMARCIVTEPTHTNANIDYVFEDMQVMSDFELHKLCKEYKSIHNFQLDDGQVTDSGKFRFLDELLPKLKDKGSRVLLFSQFTMMLDIIEVYMAERGHRFLRLDGSTPVAERQELIDSFNSNGDIFAFLLSTRAGGLGINLTAADIVVLHDIDFNPYNDKQAEDRCHRVGQTKDVYVHRLMSRGTVEEAMFRCAQRKLQLEEEVTGVATRQDEAIPDDVAGLLKQALSMDKKE